MTDDFQKMVMDFIKLEIEVLNRNGLIGLEKSNLIAIKLEEFEHKYAGKYSKIFPNHKFPEK